MSTPKRRIKLPPDKPSIQSVPTRDLVRSLRVDLDEEGRKRLKEWEAKQAEKKRNKQ
jgi:hypothetical protein